MVNPAFRLAVLNAAGRDPEQDFAAGPGEPGGPGHSPVNFHGYAACTRGSFHASLKAAVETGRSVLLLLRRDLRASLRALERLKAAGCTAAVTFKEAGAMQVAARMQRPADFETLAQIVALADGLLAPTPWMAGFWRGMAQGKACEFIPTPYPLGDSRWDFACPPEQRRGVLVGTREFDTPSRQHLAALVAARELGEPVTVFNADGRSGARMLAAVGSDLRVVNAPLPYAEYLREVARHKLVFQLDRSGVPGQVAGDALLCGIPCVGGDGATEQVVFPSLCGLGRSPDELVALALSLLRDPAAYDEACRTPTRENLSYQTVAGRLEAFFASLCS